MNGTQALIQKYIIIMRTVQKEIISRINILKKVKAAKGFALNAKGETKSSSNSLYNSPI